jgi:drug/metabolite transporter superfamily protein YnfA
MKNKSQWSAFRSELAKRTTEPLSHVSYVLYFIGAVVICGSLGVWYEIIQLNTTLQNTPNSLFIALKTFLPAMAGAASMQLILAENENKALRAFGSISLIIIALAAIAAPTKDCWITYIIYTVLYIFVLWLWFISNANQTDLKDAIKNIEAPIGGASTDVPLNGDLDGFKS